MATANHYVSLAVRLDNITMVDRLGVVCEGRKEEMDRYKARFARQTKACTLAEVIRGADVFVGLSVAGVLSGDTGGLDGGTAHPLRHGRPAR
ncbi:MAG: hypothetical protein ACE5JR_02795 [Gemmatimonadota bacterium]